MISNSYLFCLCLVLLSMIGKMQAFDINRVSCTNVKAFTSVLPPAAKKALFASAVALSIGSGAPAFAAETQVDADYAKSVCDAILRDGPDRVTDRTVSCSVPSRPRIIAMPAEEESSGNPIDAVFKLIPSTKYFKIISQEYSSRALGYDGKDNLFAPLQ